MNLIRQLIGLSIILTVPYLVFRILAFVEALPRMRRPVYCPACGHQGTPRSTCEGSQRLEMLLWFALILPGLTYSIWRFSTRSVVCAQCGSERILPPESLVARTKRQNRGLGPRRATAPDSSY